MLHRRIAFIVLMLWASSAAAQGQKPRLAIKTLDNPASAPQSAIGSALTEILTTELGRTGKYTIVEREAVQAILSEIEFGSGGQVKKQTAALKGELKGAEYVLGGRVTNFGYQEITEQGQVIVRGEAMLRTIYRQRADVRVDFRVVNVESGEVVLSESGNARQEDTSDVSWMATWNRMMASSFSISEKSESLMARTTLAAIRDVTRKLTDLSSELGSHTSESSIGRAVEQLGQAEGKILASIGSQEFIVGIGTNHGLVKGDRLRVFSEVLTRDSKGQVIYREVKDLGSLLEIVDLSMPDRSKARLIQPVTMGQLPTGGLKDGALVKVDLDHARVLRGPVDSHASAGPAPVKRAAGGSNAAEIETLVRRGDRYLEDGHYAQALEQYQRARGLNPADATVLNKIAGTHIRLVDIFEAETVYGRLIEAGLAAAIHVVHAHSFGYCEGELTFERSRVSFTPARGEDSFVVTPQTLVAIEPGTANPNAAGYLLRGGAVAFVLQDASGKRKKYTVFSNAFAQGDLTSAKQRLADTVKLSKLIERLAEKSLK